MTTSVLNPRLRISLVYFLWDFAVEILFYLRRTRQWCKATKYFYLSSFFSVTRTFLSSIFWLLLRRVEQYRGTKIPQYFFSTVIGTVDTFKEMYCFWYRRYSLHRFTRNFGLFWSKLEKTKAENFPGFSVKSIFEKYRETTLL